MIQRRGLLKDPAIYAIVAGGTSQQVLPQNNARAYIFVQNNSDITMWLDFGKSAVANQCIQLVSGAWYENPANFAPVNSVNILGATTGKQFTVREGTG